MRESQRLALRAGEIRTGLAGIGELNDEQRSEIDSLRNEYGDIERRHAAAMIAEDVPPETAHGAADLRAAAGRARVCRGLHDADRVKTQAVGKGPWAHR